jgi:pimeloyl-ACP methyl ester carboxylesterase
LIAELQTTHRVIAVEPFGTGLSDQTDTPRTAANIAQEVHEALQQLDVDRYVLMGHSISGIYALEYSARYADELVAFVGIDSSVPGQPGSTDETPTDGLATLNRLGILRVLSAISGDPYAGMPFDDETKRQMGLLSTRNATSPTILDAMNRAPENFTALRNAALPGGHYLHHTQSPAIAAETTAFLAG